MWDQVRGPELPMAKLALAELALTETWVCSRFNCSFFGIFQSLLFAVKRDVESNFGNHEPGYFFRDRFTFYLIRNIPQKS